VTSALFAFLHHVAAFAMAAALALELVLLKDPLNAGSARKLLAVDAVYGMSATVLLVVGFLRVFFFEKGAGYYFQSIPFLVKISLFAIAAILSIYPTVTFISWRKAVRQGVLPVLSEAKQRTLRSIVHWELVAVVGILLAAALMARGIGFFG
jgi:putative membrane protein